jgi:uncharacterized repeat protein (TIGR02543 family)
MKKRSIKRILASAFIIALVFSLCQFAMSEDADLYDFTITAGQATITGYLGDPLSGAISIPTSVSILSTSYPVVAIGDNAFAGMTGITSATIPSGVTSIGVGSFYGCTGLTSVTIPTSVTSIGAQAFWGCSSLAAASLPTGVATVGDAAFANCASLSSITIPSTLSTLEDGLFAECPSLIDVSIPATVTNINTGAFALCGNLASAHFLGNAPVMGDGVFDGCAGLFTVYYLPAATGFSSAWYGYAAETTSYVVTFLDGVGGTLEQQEIEHGQKVIQPPDPTRTGYTFGGWYADAGWLTAWDFNTVTITAAVSIYSKWTIIQYTISFNSNGGSAVTDVTQDYGTTIATSPASTKTGYTLAGWYTDSGLTSQATFPYTISAAATLYAKWSVNQYTISFDSNGGSTVSSITQDYGSSVTAPAAPTKAGHAFAGWSPSVPATMPVGGASLTAQWTINQYTVTFDSNGGSAVSSITQDYGSAITAPANPTRTGYYFTGWSPVVPATMPLNGVTLTAQWSSAAPSTITSSTYTTNASTGYLSKIGGSTTVASLLDQLNEKPYIHVYSGSSEVAGTALAATGMLVQLMDGADVKQTLTIAITGDLNGDGQISLTDFVKMKAHLLGIATLTGAYAKASDINGDGSSSLTDFVKMKAHLLGLDPIVPRSY